MRQCFSSSASRLDRLPIPSLLACALGVAGELAHADSLAIEDPATGIDLRVWANDGGDKVPQESLRAYAENPETLNSVWNGSAIELFAARNEVVSFGLWSITTALRLRRQALFLIRLITPPQAYPQPIRWPRPTVRWKPCTTGVIGRLKCLLLSICAFTA